MKSLDYFKKWLKWGLIVLLPIQWLAYRWLKLQPDVADSYAFNIYPNISSSLRWLFGWIPFSLGQWIFYAFVIYLLWSVWKLIRVLRNREVPLYETLIKTSTKLASYLSFIYLLFNVIWGINYYRNTIDNILNLEQIAYQTDDLNALCRELIVRSNNLRLHITDVNNVPEDSLFSLAENGYRVASENYPWLSNTNRSVKAVAFPRLMSYAGIGGIYFPFTGEANINTHPPAFKLPFTICHEMAHQVGFASETEANFVAYLVCRDAPDSFSRYSGYFSAMRYSMAALYRSDSLAYRELTELYSDSVKADLRANRKYWLQFKTPFDKVSESVNDLFLKANGQKEGVQTYGKMVDLLLADFLKRKAAAP